MTEELRSQERCRIQAVLDNIGDQETMYIRAQVVEDLHEMKMTNEVKNDVKKQFFLNMQNPHRICATLERLKRFKKNIRK